MRIFQSGNENLLVELRIRKELLPYHLLSYFIGQTTNIRLMMGDVYFYISTSDPTMGGGISGGGHYGNRFNNNAITMLKVFFYPHKPPQLEFFVIKFVIS